MKADFSGYATKAGLKCTDGRTIMPDAFKHQDKTTVPLVWSHGHSEPENVLGHAVLENRPDGVYAYGFFNESARAVHTKGLVKHGDITMLSIWANQLIERSQNVLHGAIREVSLVLAGANPGAMIDNVAIEHSDGSTDVVADEAIIYTGLQLEHASGEEEEEEEKTDEVIEQEEEDLLEHADMKKDGKSYADKKVVADDATISDVYDSMSDAQKDVLHYMLGEALATTPEDNEDSNELKQSDNNTEGTDTMKHNVFESQGGDTKDVLSHDDVKGILSSAARSGSLKHAVEEYALAHGITSISTLFPDAQTVTNVPEWVKRRTEWVDVLLADTRKSPFARVKTLSADLTYDEARAKGYVKGTLKREEFFAVAGRTTSPTTIYKKQALDRDDMIDITDFDVIAWLKAEMRIMLDEELARAILLGDGRDPASEDKVNEGNIRPISKDNELYTTVLNVNVDDANSSANEIIDAVILNRHEYKGSGIPVFFTTDYWIARFMVLKDADGRRLYKSLDELASELRVSKIVPVEVMSEYEDIIGVIVNPVDYVLGANKGGEVNMFDDFDIDYNKQKYLIETRVSGALVKIKSAMVIKRVTPSSAVLVTPTEPTFVATTGVVTIPTQTGTVYKNAAGTTLTAGAQTAIAAGASITIYAYPASSSYFFATSEDDTWTYTRNP